MEIHTVPYDNGTLYVPVVALQVANSGCSTIHGISQGEKQSADF